MDDIDDPVARQAAWQRQQRRVRRSRDLGLLVLTLGVLILVYVALVASSR